MTPIHDQPRISLVSFGDSQYRKALNRLASQARDSGFFDLVNMKDEKCLSDEFRLRHKKILNNWTRGYGYWIWKPRVLLDEMLSLRDGDFVVYADVGCHINANGRARFMEYIEKSSQSKTGFLCFSQSSAHLKTKNLQVFYPENLNGQWTKGDLLDRYGLRGEISFTDQPQLCAGILIIKVNELSLEIVREWLDGCEQDYSLISDAPSKSPNEKGFVENRHDQSVLNCVLHKYITKIAKVSYFETWPGYPPKGVGFMWDSLDCSPIHAKRDTERYRTDAVKVLVKKQLHKYLKTGL